MARTGKILYYSLLLMGTENVHVFMPRNSRSKWPHALMCGYTAVLLMGLRVRIPQEHGFLSLVSVVCCQVEISASG
jgi:Cu/Ag efflux pump CusA